MHSSAYEALYGPREPETYQERLAKKRMNAATAEVRNHALHTILHPECHKPGCTRDNHRKETTE